MPASVSDTQKRLKKLSPSDAKYRPLLHELLSHQDLRPYVQSLHGSDLEGFIELLDKALSHTPVTDDLFRKALRRLQSICSNREVLPRSHLIPNESLSKRGEIIAAGGFADAHEAELDGKKVCIKVIRSYTQDTRGVTKKMFYKEVVVWKRLRHPNIVPFLGVPTIIPPFEIVCDWMDNHRITDYVKKNPEVDCVDLLWDVADGLHYLHSCNVIHGDLKGTNILVDGEGRARLTDFGLASIVRGENSVTSPQDSNMENTTWAAPEILEGGPASKEGDVFTFAMVAVETFTGKPPFVVHSHAATFEIMNGKRPGRPVTLRHEGLWEITTRSWSKIPGERPTAFGLVKFFRKSFPRKRETPETQPLPSTPSTWTLVASDGKTDGKTEPRSDPSRQVTLDGGEPTLRDPSAGDPQVDGHKSQGRPNPSVKDSVARDGKSLPQSGGKPSRLKRTGRRLKEFIKRIFGRKPPE